MNKRGAPSSFWWDSYGVALPGYPNVKVQWRAWNWQPILLFHIEKASRTVWAQCQHGPGIVLWSSWTVHWKLHHVQSTSTKLSQLVISDKAQSFQGKPYVSLYDQWLHSNQRCMPGCTDLCGGTQQGVMVLQTLITGVSKIKYVCLCALSCMMALSMVWWCCRHVIRDITKITDACLCALTCVIMPGKVCWCCRRVIRDLTNITDAYLCALTCVMAPSKVCWCCRCVISDSMSCSSSLLTSASVDARKS